MLKKQKSLADKVTENILRPSGSESDSSEEATAAKVVDYDDCEYELPSAETTDFRKRNVKLLSEQNEKYKGKIASRKDFNTDQSEDEVKYESSNTSDEGTLTTFNYALTKSRRKQVEDFSSKNQEIEGDGEEINFSDFENSENEGIENDDEQESGDFSDSDNDEIVSDSENECKEDNEVLGKINHEAERQKGFSVQNQLRIWERLLELRIHLQKVVNKNNHIPASEDLKHLENNDIYKNTRETTCKQVCLLLQNLISLKKSLSLQFPEVGNVLKPSLKRELPFKEQDLEEPPLKQFSEYLEDEFTQFRPYRNDILLKWDDRTKLLQHGVGNKKKTFNVEYDIIKKIDNSLINKALLIKKSQQVNIAGQSEPQQEIIPNPNAYDDSDFYHEQLRELIEYKSNTTSNMGEVTKQFLELQKLRQKMKKKVDTKASKGRKLRYIVHNKLINFMAPREIYTWTMESIDELSKSLFV